MTALRPAAIGFAVDSDAWGGLSAARKERNP
ncbi:Uncharacterised protein [Vibrio cholerae]|nr:Uncharacterised protein [Vibrio cholerae]